MEAEAAAQMKRLCEPDRRPRRKESEASKHRSWFTFIIVVVVTIVLYLYLCASLREKIETADFRPDGRRDEMN
jgi:hypothetical protein